ncbi:glycosyltransferase [Aquabacterium sp.]|uniref:glycosyltransferase family 4 protein n=1 Tax=Aquabacterium sp. TaxID=1872578 RepID=UPI0019A6CAAD|nr:glycosyltransferase [Aquabacterium sp.]MBC7701808.1 glycosyltransferase [Aquabacterium sp.]
MKIALSTIGTFHSFDLARELHVTQSLAAIFTGYPQFKLKSKQLPAHLIRTFPWVHTPYMAFKRKDILGINVVRAWEQLDRTTFDRHVVRNLPDCDVFVGMSGSALCSGRAAQRRGARYVCDRGSSHIRVQDQLLREEADRWGLSFEGIDLRAMEREEAEYAQSDCITVPSSFSLESFVQQGVARQKMRLLPYGVNLNLFQPNGHPEDGRFDVLYVGGMNLNKGIPYLLQAYQAFRHPRKSLSLAGTPSPGFIASMKRHGLWHDSIRVLGHVPQVDLASLMSRSHVMVLASVQEGLALVQAQALASGCVVIGTENTGARDLFDDGREGFIVPIRDPAAITERLQQLADSPELRAQMSRSALIRVQSAGGWRDYGMKAQTIYRELMQ